MNTYICEIEKKEVGLLLYYRYIINKNNLRD